MQKKCSKCHENKDVSLFFRKKDGYQSICKVCAKQYALKYNKENAEKIAKKTALYRKNNDEKIKILKKNHYEKNKDLISNKNSQYYKMNSKSIILKTRKYYLENKENIKIKRREYIKKNPEVKIRSESKRRFSKNNGSLSKGIINKLFILQKGLCIVCRCKLHKYHLDHIIPLALNGLNIDNNVQLLCPKCNMQKNAKHPIKFMQEKGYLL